MPLCASHLLQLSQGEFSPLQQMEDALVDFGLIFCHDLERKGGERDGGKLSSQWYVPVQTCWQQRWSYARRGSRKTCVSAAREGGIFRGRWIINSSSTSVDGFIAMRTAFPSSARSSSSMAMAKFLIIEGRSERQKRELHTHNNAFSLGPIGSGKSSLMRNLALLHPALGLSARASRVLGKCLSHPGGPESRPIGQLLCDTERRKFQHSTIRDNKDAPGAS